MANNIVVNDYVKCYEKQKLYENFSTTFVDKSINIIVGPNGSGKTTLINSILNFDTNYHGSITKIENKKYMYIPDESELPWLLSGGEYILYFMRLHNIEPILNEKLILLFNMEKEMNKLIGSYSYGMKKKIQIMLAWHIKPEILIMDELFRGLDFQSINITVKILQKLKNYSNLILTTHDINLINQVGDNIVVIVNGKKRLDGKISAIEQKYDNTISKILEEYIFDQNIEQLLNGI